MNPLFHLKQVGKPNSVLSKNWRGQSFIWSFDYSWDHAPAKKYFTGLHQVGFTTLFGFPKRSSVLQNTFHLKLCFSQKRGRRCCLVSVALSLLRFKNRKGGRYPLPTSLKIQGVFGLSSLEFFQGDCLTTCLYVKL